MAAAGRSAPPGAAVAAVGSSEAELLSNIHLAKHRGHKTRFVLVKSGGKRHVFSVFAQIVRTADNVFVRGNKRLYVFPASNTKVEYNKADVTDDLPVVTLSKAMTTLVKANAAKYQGAYRATSPSQRAHFDTSWAGLKDPWQVNPDYTVVADEPATTTTSKSATRSTSFVRCNDWDNVCYYYYDMGLRHITPTTSITMTRTSR